MKSLFYITCDSGCDLPIDFLSRNDVSVIRNSYSINGEQYKDSMNYENKKSFYKFCRKGANCKANFITLEDVKNVWNNIDEPIIHISVSGAISNAYERCVIESNLMNKEIYVIDSKTTSAGVGMLIIDAIKLRDEGKTVKEAYECLIGKRDEIVGIFLTDNKEYLCKKGLLEKSKFFFKKLFRRNYIIKEKPNGQFYEEYTTHTKKLCNKKIIESIKNQASDPSNQCLYICHADDAVNAKELGEKIKQEVGFKDVYVTLMGPTNASSTGPNFKGYFFYGRKSQ